MAANKTDDGWLAFRYPDVRLFYFSRLSSTLASAMQNVAVGWFVYELTRDPFALGLTGLFTFLPMLVFCLITGQVADNYDRRLVVSISTALAAFVSAGLLVYSLAGHTTVWPIYILMALVGTSRAFGNPAYKALLPTLVPREHFGNTVAWNSSFEQFANTAGPAIGGLLYMLGPNVVFGLAMVLYAASAIATFLIRTRPEPVKREKVTWQTMSAGLRYIYSQKTIFGAISLDMCAVLLGGVTALLPIFSDALGAGAWGTGFLRSAQSIGAFTMAYVLAHHPVKRRSGRKLVWSVGAFGLSILVFGLSNSIILSVLALFAAGAADQISVYIRHTIVQTDTPDSMRGRVSAVNVIFVGASGSLGEFESGTLAALVGAVPAVAIGGVGAMLCAALWAVIFSTMRERDELVPKEDPAAAK